MVRKIVLASRTDDRADAGPGLSGSPVVGTSAMPKMRLAQRSHVDERAEAAERPRPSGGRGGVRARASPARTRAVAATAAGGRRARRDAASSGHGVGMVSIVTWTGRRLTSGRSSDADRRTCVGPSGVPRRVLDRAAGGLDRRDRGGEVDRRRAARGAWRGRHRRRPDRARGGRARPARARGAGRAVRARDPGRRRHASTGPRSPPRRSPTTRSARRLEAITHPAIGAEFLRRMSEAPAGRRSS